MQIATIVPAPHLHLTNEDPYLMALAHVAEESSDYAAWFRSRSRSGAFVLLDNGAAEIGDGIDVQRVVSIAHAVRASEVVLPDAVSDVERTLMRGREALNFTGLHYSGWTLMAVPQGRTAEEYLDCVREMRTWPIQALGVSRFLVNTGVVAHRREIVGDILEITDGALDLHLLGCPDDPIEAYEIETAYPGAFRGTDSGIAAIFTQAGEQMGIHGRKPVLGLDFLGELDDALLETNIALWRNRVLTGRWHG